MNKIKEFFEDLVWNIKAFLTQPYTPIVSMDYVITHNGSYSSNDFMTDKYVHYWIGDFNTGKEVKVKSADVLKYEYNKLKFELTEIKRNN